MFRNYIKIAIRSLFRNKAFSAINILGLAIGIGTCLIILLFAENELTYDRFNKKADRIVRVNFQGIMQGEKMKESSVMPPVAQTLLSQFPQVREATRLRAYGIPRVIIGNQLFTDEPLCYVDSNFFNVFTIPLLKGNPSTALLQPNSIVISQAASQKYFGTGDPMGKLIQLKDSPTPFVVTGLSKNIPVNAQFHFSLFVSMASLPESRSDSWMTSNFFTFLVLNDPSDITKVAAGLPAVINKFLGPQMKQAMGLTLEQFRQKGNDIGFQLQPLTDIHLHSDSSNDLEPGGDIRYVYILSAIALFMLLIACINFMNLSTAGSAKRAREVGIRKVMGSVKGQLIRQFLLESMLLSFIAIVLSIAFVHFALPVFNYLSGKQLTFSISDKPWLLPSLVCLGLLVGLIAGSYPAFYLSSFNPVSVLKGKFTAGRGSAGFRSGLVVFQFLISIILIICTTVVHNQLSFIQQQKLGYDRDQVIVLPGTYALGKSETVFRSQLLRDPRVRLLTSSGYLPAGNSDGNNFFISPDNNAAQLLKTLRYDVDENYIPTLGMQLAAGRNFSAAYGTDSTAAILNETAVRQLGWSKDPMSHTFSKRENNGVTINYHVVGVVKDFFFRSMHEKITPLVMVRSNPTGTMIIKTRTGDIAGLLTTMKKDWESITREVPFDYSFLDERFMRTYEAEQKTGLTLGIFSALTIFVACLGLFGLVTFTAEQRKKEIGIRKVLGCTVTGIVALLSKDFLKLVAIAILIACPVAGYIMNKWLQDFAYHENISWYVFALAGLLAIIITLVTMGIQSVRAALANPADNLRSE